MADDLVKVAVRIRPLIQSEVDKNCQLCLNVTPGQPQIQISSDKAFTFNYVFPPDSSQEYFYNTAIKNMVSNIFQGYNVTILAYGQTGSGKTFSMGTNYNDNDENCGIIPRAVNDIFNQIKIKNDWDFKVSVTFMELYKEQLFDLLSKKPRNQCTVDIREDVRGIKLIGASDIPVSSTKEALQYLAEGSLRRATGSTAMNIQSSRSHAIFTISVQQQLKDEINTAKFAKFHLVDLAGSERSKKTQASGERFKEGVNINKGLLALGNVISQLGEGGNSSYIGYRDSKLTRLLQDSLGGNSVTLMVACVSPADYNMDETISTLRYADRAKKIKNKPIINQDPQVAEINNLKKIIRELQSALYTQGNGESLCPPQHAELEDKNQILQRKVRCLTRTLSENIVEIVHLHELANLAEHSREELKSSITLILEDCENLLKELDANPCDIESHKSKLEAICLKLLTVQKNQKQAIISHNVSVECSNNISASSEPLSVTEDENNLFNETYDWDEKHEEHTLQQAKRVDEVQSINKELAMKEELVSSLLKNSQVLEYQKELEEMEQEIKALQNEKIELMAALQNAQANTTSAKIAETRRKKVQELEKKITELSRKCLKQNRIIKIKEKTDVQIKNLSKEIDSLKQTKVKLVRNMRVETDKFNKWKRSREQELYKLKDQDRKRLNQITRMQAEYNRQKNVFKRKMEEAQAIQKRLKNALDLQKKTHEKREKASNAKEHIHSWVAQEWEVLLSTVEAECTLERLKQDKAYYANQLANLQLNDNSLSSKETEISEIMEYIELRNAQIKEIEQNINESNQEARAKTRWQTISSMADAKEALRTLFEVAASNSKECCLLKSKHKDLMEHNEKLKVELEKYELKQSNFLSSNEGPSVSNNKEVSDYEKDQQINMLKEQNELYKQQLEMLQNKRILTDKNVNMLKKPSCLPKHVTEEIFPDSFFTDESISDDLDNDPDWIQTPLYHRIIKLEKTTKNVARESKIHVKRSSDGEIKCSCKTRCSSRVCSCRKNDVSCSKCNCNPETCTNRDDKKTQRTLFIDTNEINEEPELKIKKIKIENVDENA